MIAEIDSELQIKILDTLQGFYPGWAHIENEDGEVEDPFWKAIPERRLAANLAYLEEMKQVKVKWEYGGPLPIPQRAKIVKKGIDRLSDRAILGSVSV